MAELDASVVWNNAKELRYELLLTDGRHIGEIRYRLEAGAVALVYIDVAPAYEHRGFATRLIAAALRDIRSRGESVIPVAPMVADYIRLHPEDADLVASDPAVPE